MYAALFSCTAVGHTGGGSCLDEGFDVEGFPLPLCTWEWLRYLIVVLPGPSIYLIIRTSASGPKVLPPDFKFSHEALVEMVKSVGMTTFMTLLVLLR